VRELAKALRHRIVGLGGRIANQFDLRAIVLAEERQQILAEHVISKQSADVTDAKPAVGRALVAMCLAALAPRPRMPNLPLRVLAPQRSLVEIGMEQQRVEIAAMNAGRIWSQGHRTAMRR